MSIQFVYAKYVYVCIRQLTFLSPIRTNYKGPLYIKYNACKSGVFFPLWLDRYHLGWVENKCFKIKNHEIVGRNQLLRLHH